VIGIEISPDSVKYAALNAERNGILNTRFLTGKAEGIFEVVETPADGTAVIIDPPRKVRIFSSPRSLNYILPSLSFLGGFFRFFLFDFVGCGWYYFEIC
jgi:23S rRNA G2445 N2-methylase RlmL